MKPLPVEGCVPPELLAPLSGKSVLITGAGGFVGRWMWYTWDTWDNTMTCIGPKGWDNAECRKYDYIAHCTADGADLDRALRLLKPDGRLLYLSSGAVYGEGGPTQETELEVRRKRNDYARLKIGHEMQLMDSGKNYVVARMFSFVGPGLRRHTGQEFLEADPIRVKDDGAVRSYMWAGDMARWLWTLLLQGRIGEAYNVGSEVPTSVVDFARMCAKVRGVRCEVAEGSGGTRYVPDTMKARTELGLTCGVTAAGAVMRTLEWQK